MIWLKKIVPVRNSPKGEIEKKHNEYKGEITNKTAKISGEIEPKQAEYITTLAKVETKRNAVIKSLTVQFRTVFERLETWYSWFRSRLKISVPHVANLDEGQASDLTADKETATTIKADASTEATTDLNVKRNTKSVVSVLLDAWEVGEMWYRKKTRTSKTADLESPEGKSLTSRKKIAVVLTAFLEGCEGVIAKAQNKAKLTIKAKADSAATINAKAARAIKANPDISVNHAACEDLTIGRGVNTLSAASIELMRWHWTNGDILTIAQTKYAKQVDDALYLDGALAFLWEAKQSGDSLMIGQVYSATQNETELGVI